MGYDHHTQDYFTKQERKEKVVRRMQEGDWEGVLEEFQSEDEYREPLLLWIRPTLATLTIIQSQVTSLGLSGISSVGCGCGTLEWLIQAGTGLCVKGYEVNRIWWEGVHSTPHFIDIEYVDEVEGKNCPIPATTALLFCYFNNLPYFHQYLLNFQGPCVILIGPVDGERHCEPEPGYLTDHEDWVLRDKMDIWGEDEIAVYTRRRK